MSAADTKTILAIDLGTSGPKVALVSIDGEVIDHDFEETPILLLPEGGAEQRPDDWWQAIKTATRRMLERASIPSTSIAAIKLTTQWSGTVAVDREGRPLMNAIIWMDARGAPYVARIIDGPLKIEGYALRKMIRWLRLTGGAPGHSGKGPLGHILYIKHQRPEIYQATYKFLEPMDYLNLRLTGKFAASYDSIALHWVTDNRDIDRVAYDDGLIKMSGVEREKLPDIQPANSILGPLCPEAAAELGLPESAQVIMGTPDVHSAAVGSGAVQDFQGHLYIGTSSWLVCHVPYKKTDIFHNMASLPSALPGKYLLVNEQETAGACLNFLRDNILYHQDELLAEQDVPDVYKIFDRIVERAPAGSGNLIFTPWLYGERTPVEDHHVRGGLYNVSLQTTREHLIRAVFEGVAYNARWLLGYVEKFIGREFDAVDMIGGGANSDIWCQIHADVFDRHICQMKDPIQANFRGAAFLASVALGYLKVDDIPERIKIAKTYTPNPQNRAIYDELFAEFVDLYKREKKFYSRLNRPR